MSYKIMLPMKNKNRIVDFCGNLSACVCS